MTQRMIKFVTREALYDDEEEEEEEGDEERKLAEDWIEKKNVFAADENHIF